MTFQFANVGGRAALVNGEHWYDLEDASEGVLSSNPIQAIAASTQLHELRLDSCRPSGLVADTYRSLILNGLLR